MLQQEDAPDFVEAMQTEIRAHESRGHWVVVKRSSIPAGVKTIQAIWSFKRKHFLSGELDKHKDRLCAHGGMQQWGVNYWEKYAPVVNWISMRFLLILSEIAELESQAIDFVLAFLQADLDVPVYMELPTGMVLSDSFDHPKSNVLRLKKSIYGLKQASLNWYDMLAKELRDRDFKEASDPCVFCIMT